MKKPLLLLLAALYSIGVYAQHKCGTDLWIQEQIKKNPNFEQVVEQNWALSDQMPHHHTSSEGRAIDIIPVVVHVIHDNGIGDISYEQIQDAIRVLNEDFRRMNADTVGTNSIFKPYAVDSEIEFRLAKIDPNGDCTNGVVRINNPSQTYDADNSVKSLSYWSSSMYMNMWIVNSIANFSGTNGTILGYAQFPGSGSWNTYGLVMRHDQFGTIGTSNADGRTLTHEIGHCLNLLHTFQSGCGSSCSSTGDRVCDTPPVFESTQGCSKSQNTCSNDLVGPSVYGSDVVDQIENYMSYDDCQNMFSAGQKLRMKSALSSFSNLQNLVSASNLAATGTDISNNPQLCEADFEANRTIICAGNTVTFEDLSIEGVTTHNWTFNGGFPQTSNTAVTSVRYDIPGVYDVTLEVGNGTTNVQSTKSQYIVVLPSAGINSPVVESFEDLNSLGTNTWQTESLFQGIGWELNSQNSASGSNSMKVDNYGYTRGQVELISPVYDLTNLLNATIEFERAHAQRTASSVDRMSLQVSSDCGETWVPLWGQIANQLATTSLKTTPYTTVASADWENETVLIPDSLFSENFKMKFVFINGGGNDLYLDDVNISGLLVKTPLLVYPLNGQTNVPQGTFLDWKAAAAADVYEIQLDTSLSFNSPLVQNFTNPYIGSSSTDVDTEYGLSSLLPLTTYYWKVRTRTGSSSFSWSDTWSFTTDQFSSTSSIQNRPDEVSIYPNPARDNAQIELSISEVKEVRIDAVSLVGQQSSAIFSGELVSGKHTIQVNTSEWPKGIYLIRIFAADDLLVKRFIVQ